MPAGSGRGERLDPLALPLRFQATDHTADERLRTVELHRERVVLRRALHGIKMAVQLPVAAYLGVSIRMLPPSADSAGAVTVTLEHRDPALSLELFRSEDGSEVLVEWQTWARELALPLLIAEADGTLRDAFARIGAVRVGEAIARRRRRSALFRRRPTLSLRRRAVASGAQPVVHRGEREIIARN
jgi:hypothetical protein